MQPHLRFYGVINQIRIVVQLDSEPRLLHQNSAFAAGLHVQLNFLYDRGFQIAIDIARDPPH
jgi:hypothetical protein